MYAITQQRRITGGLSLDINIAFFGEPVFRGIRNSGIAKLRNKRKSHSKYFVIVYSLYNVLIYIPHLVEKTITMALILGAIFK